MWTGILPTPDPGFMRKLKTFDPNLDCEFNRECECFIITQPSRLGSGRLVAGVIANPEGIPGYRQPDDRDIAALARADFERKDHKTRIREGEEKMLEAPKKNEAFAEDEIKHATRENKNRLRRMAAQIRGDGGDAVNPAYRRITPKSKGYTVVDKRKLSNVA